jgi:uncharacterized protein YjbI with pentapeptide repeats
MPAPIVAWITIGLAVLAALLAIAVWLWWWLPKREVTRLALKIRDAKARADVEDNFRKTVGQALGSVAVLLGAAVTLLGAYVAYLQFSQQQRASHDLLISNQVSKGFEQLGSEKVVVRLGGVYALEGVMNNSDQYHQPVLEALSAFVREGVNPPTSEPPLKQPSVSEKPPTDIQAALTVIGRREAGFGTVDLSGARIVGADLKEADLTGADLHGVNLSDAMLFYTRLSDAILSAADLTGADLTGADLTKANLTQAELFQAHLTGANLNNANLAAAGLNNADLTRAQLGSADLTLANLAAANLAAANLRSAKLIHANLFLTDLTGADLTGADLTGADFTKADLTDARVEGQAQLDPACGSNAKLPSGLTLKPCPSKSSP